MMDRDVLPARYPKQMEDHFNRLSDELQLARGFAADADTWQHRRPQVRAALLEALGGLPERTPLNARTLGTVERDGYTIEKVIFESRPDFHVTGALYRPHTDQPLPAIFCPHGHYAVGRYDPGIQTRLANYARRGYVGLIIDKVGYMDRRAQNHSTRAPLLYGQSTQGIQLWDNMRAIDYLLARPEVLPDRLGITGCSGGGNQTMYLAALDERVTAAAPVCSVELGECYLHKLYCTCELVPGLRRFADLVDVCGLVAPRALLLVHGIRDSGFWIDSARKALARIRLIYQALGRPDLIDQFTSFDEHGYNQEMREAVYAWFDRHLKGLPPPYAGEVAVPVETDETICCLPDGLPAGAQTMTDVYRANTANLPPRPAVATATAWRAEAVRLRQALADLFSGWPAVTPLRLHPVATVEAAVGGVPAHAESLYYYSEPDVIVPAVLYRPAAGGTGEVTIRFGVDGRCTVPEAAIATDLRAGRGTFALDLRGTGETRAGEPGRSDWQAYLASVTLGRHFAAMRAWDVRRAVDLLTARPEVTRVGVAAHGSLLDGLVALLAAATDPRLAWFAADQLLASYKEQDDFGELAEAGQSAIIPRLLTVADIDDLLALVAPRAIAVAQWVDGQGQALPPAAARTARCQQVYALLDATAQLQWPA